MKTFILLALASLSMQANAALCTAEVCKSDDSGCNKVFRFVKDKPTKTISGTVAKLKPCTPPSTLIEDVDADKDACMAVEITYVNRDTKKLEKQYYKNGATSADGVTWDREPNPNCPAIN